MTETPDLTAVPFHLRTPVYRYHQLQEKPNDCGPTSLAIAANAFLGEERFQGSTVAQEMNHPAFEVRPFPHFVLRRFRNWATFPWGIVHYLRRNGIPSDWSRRGTEDRLRSNLRNDRITIVILGEPWRWRKWRYRGWSHAKILFGYTPRQGFLFVDPGRARRPDDSGSWAQYALFWQPEREFLRQWRNTLRIFIEVG